MLLLFYVACDNVNVPVGSGISLASLTVSSGTLTPAFDPAITAYTVHLDNTATTITIAGTATNANNTVSYNPAQPATLTVGSNLITVRVTGTPGLATTDYQVVVIRAESDKAHLASLSVQGGMLSPDFDATVTNYNLASYVSNNVTDALVTAVAMHGGASLSFPAGTSLSVGSNQVVVRVTAEDGTTTKDYFIRIYRMGSDYNSVTLGTLKYVPAGTFQRDENPANISFVSAFHMSSYEITRSQFSNVMGVDPTTIESSGTSDPVQTVTWYHAIAFCNKLSIAEGLTPVYWVYGVNFGTLTHADVPLTSNLFWDEAKADRFANGYRLPTEMEWMWAAMGANMGADPFAVNTSGYGKAFAGSDGTNSIDNYAWYGYFHGGSATTMATTAAGSKLPNELGLKDMSGNVWEWCWDWFVAAYPAGYLKNYRGASSGGARVLRGACWLSEASWLTIAHRGKIVPYYRASNFGFRVVRP